MNKKTSVITYKEDCYTNDDAYERVITYNMKNEKIGGYLLYPPFERDSLIQQFEYCEANSLHYIESKLWHFMVSISNVNYHHTLLLLGNEIASLFTPDYQVMYTLDTCTKHNHLHFIVNAYHCQPNGQPLSKELFQYYLNEISRILITKFPTHQILIEKKEDTDYYV